MVFNKIKVIQGGKTVFLRNYARKNGDSQINSKYIISI